ncbi:hypothetical protein MXAN_3651 [Myxococcus xanthus DK 1622]|uniref:YetF C-terminal domain-containing protein n=2 Tax=Myxococcaceae TaxID=31 RepID=Q1D685_MYXXD|nr:hypothetical protein MXAN_3651 [Myxococcus xanthus DK 1622]
MVSPRASAPAPIILERVLARSGCPGDVWVRAPTPTGGGARGQHSNMKPIDWHGLWVPDLHPFEVIIRVSLVFLFVQFVLRLVGRKELSRYVSFDLALVHGNLRKTRISHKELLSHLRAHGRGDLSAVHAAFLEPNGKVTFLFREEGSATLR